MPELLLLPFPGPLGLHLELRHGLVVFDGVMLRQALGHGEGKPCIRDGQDGAAPSSQGPAQLILALGDAQPQALAHLREVGAAAGGIVRRVRRQQQETRVSRPDGGVHRLLAGLDLSRLAADADHGKDGVHHASPSISLSSAS